MSDTLSQASDREPLRPRARLLRIVGNELISSETVAVLELVKNAYDADATRVLVRFHEPIQINKGKIEIIDNGHGMSLDIIKTAWLEIGTLFKKRQPRSKYLQRRVLGEKGVGRFAASKLANYLEVVTRYDGSNHEVRVFFDWSQFDDDQKYLDQVEVLWEDTEPVEIRPGGTIQELWRDTLPPDDQLTHGTILRIEELHSIWEERQFRELQTGLARLVSPFLNEDGVSQKNSFQIYLSLPEKFKSMSGLVRSPEALKSPHYSLNGCIDELGHYTLTLKLRNREDQEELKDQFLPGGHVPQCGPFCVDLRVWDRDALGEIAQKYGSTTQNVRRDLDAAAGINIYRDGFRVLPYGEAGNDWLELNQRRVNNPTLRLSNNQIVGYVLISADKNPELRDQSNREGIVEGPALNDLREIIKMMLVELEGRRFDIRRSLEDTQPTTPVGGIFADFTLEDVQNLVKQQHPDDSALISLVNNKEKDLERRIEAVRVLLSQNLNLTTLGFLIDRVLHDGRTPLAKIITESKLGQRDINSNKKDEDCFTLLQKLLKRFEFVSTQSEYVASLFRKLEPFGGRRRSKPSMVYLEQAIADAFSLLQAEITEVGVQVILPETKTLLLADQAEIQSIIINLLQNSLYWLIEVPQSERQIAVQVTQNTTDEVYILFADSGKGVPSSFRERIFEPYFSRKPDGTGLGLTIANELVHEYYNGKVELVETDLLPGANFLITIHKRV